MQSVCCSQIYQFMDAWAAYEYEAMCCDQPFFIFMHRWLLVYCFLGCHAFHREKLMAAGAGFWVGVDFSPLWRPDSWGTLSLSCILHTLQINITMHCIHLLHYYSISSKVTTIFIYSVTVFIVYDCDRVSMRICLDNCHNNKLLMISFTGYH